MRFGGLMCPCPISRSIIATTYSSSSNSSGYRLRRLCSMEIIRCRCWPQDLKSLTLDRKTVLFVFFFQFVLEKKRSDYLAEAKYHKFVALVKLLKYDIHRKAENNCRNFVDSFENMLDYSEEPNYLTHMR